jgi:hypothetical protein
MKSCFPMSNSEYSFTINFENFMFSIKSKNVANHHFNEDPKLIELTRFVGRIQSIIDSRLRTA